MSINVDSNQLMSNQLVFLNQLHNPFTLFTESIASTRTEKFPQLSSPILGCHECLLRPPLAGPARRGGFPGTAHHGGGPSMNGGEFSAEPFSGHGVRQVSPHIIQQADGQLCQ